MTAWIECGVNLRSIFEDFKTVFAIKNQSTYPAARIFHRLFQPFNNVIFHSINI